MGLLSNVVRARNLCCNRVKFFIKFGFNPIHNLFCFEFCLCKFCFGRLGCIFVSFLVTNNIWKYSMYNLCAYPSCIENLKTCLFITIKGINKNECEIN